MGNPKREAEILEHDPKSAADEHDTQDRNGIGSIAFTRDNFQPSGKLCGSNILVQFTEVTSERYDPKEGRQSLT
ncbi:unnamed protein product [Merluccius merluccius]